MSWHLYGRLGGERGDQITSGVKSGDKFLRRPSHSGGAGLPAAPLRGTGQRAASVWRRRFGVRLHRRRGITGAGGFGGAADERNRDHHSPLGRRRPVIELSG